ncbi:hypothetical protein F4779DRAFT_616498 [Xylariaceae sp. FL0662B]|nr:hypothetical protein F4779DRAFT_616498 [Xylariaceae sp. FL0662B]
MVKTNRFVRVESTSGPIRTILEFQEIPVVTDKAEYVERFKGYVLSLSMSVEAERMPDPARASDLLSRLPPYSCILLGRDLDRFTKSFSRSVTLSISVAPLNELRVADRAAFEGFFSETTQRNLLRPFQNNIRGTENVQVRGRVTNEIANAVREHMARDEWTNPTKVVDEAMAIKERGNSLFHEDKHTEAKAAWHSGWRTLKRVRGSISWTRLLARGGQAFLDGVGELYCLFLLNIASCEVVKIENGAPSLANFMAHAFFENAKVSLKPDFWSAGRYRWEPSDLLKAKVYYREHKYYIAVHMVQEAIECMNDASRSLPSQNVHEVLGEDIVY